MKKGRKFKWSINVYQRSTQSSNKDELLSYDIQVVCEK